VLEISTMFDHFCDIRDSSITLMWKWNRRWHWSFHYVIALLRC